MIRYLPALGEHEPTNGYGTGIEGAAIGVTNGLRTSWDDVRKIMRGAKDEVFKTTWFKDIVLRPAKSSICLFDTGFVLDFGVLKKAVQEFVVDKFDHGFLNEYLEYPTCENMCKWIWAQLSPHIKGLSLVKVQETDGSYCTFSENA
jgi:hypothetical protein